MQLRDRVVELVRVKASELVPNEKNWRQHTDEQRMAYRGLVQQIGFAGVELARRLDDGRLCLIDGHMRREEHPDEMLPVIVTDLTEAESDILLATYDPIAGLAGTDKEKLQALIDAIDIESAELQAVLDDLAGEDQQAAAKELEMRQEYSVLVHCDDEPQQRVILEELNRHGLNTRALIVDFPKTEKKPAKAGPKLKDGEIEIVRSSEIERTTRVIQLEGLFDIPPSKRREEKWRLKIALDKPWEIGLVVGPSGSGKTTLARELFGKSIVSQWPWTLGHAVIDDFPQSMSITDITAILSSVGFSSPPSWLKPFSALSNGEQFRVMLARTLAEQPDLAVVDEFTSVVDRTVAKIGSAALAKAIRGTGRQFIAVSCHHDVEEWLQPDWKIEMPSGQLTWRLLRRRPEIELRIRRASRTEWPYFACHHYLSHDLNKSSQCFVGEVEERPAAFTAALFRPHATNGGYWSEHRTVCHPDFQGVGIGNRMSEYIASLFACKGRGYRSVTTHPAMILHRMRSALWRCTRTPALGTAIGTSAAYSGTVKDASAAYRLSASFKYIGEQRVVEAKVLGVI